MLRYLLLALTLTTLTGCSSVKPLSGDLYSIVGTDLQTIHREAYAFCAKRFPSQFMVRNISGQGGFPAYPDPEKVEIVFRCVTWSKDAPPVKRPRAPQRPMNLPPGL